MRAREVVAPRRGVARGAGAQRCRRGRVAVDALDTVCDERRDARRALIAEGQRDLLPARQLQHVVRPAGLRARADGRALPAAEWLASDDRARDRPIHVEIARLDAVDPPLDLAVVERLD